MKHILTLTALTTLGAVAFVPASAQAETTDSNEHATYKTYKEVVYYQQPNVAIEANVEDLQGSYPLADGSGDIMIKGEGVYLIDENGRKFLAPNGSHLAQNGISFVSEDGLLLRTETPPEMAILRVDTEDQNNNGLIDDVDVDVYTR